MSHTSRVGSVLADALHRLAGFPPRRIVGYSLNDSLRFRMALGRELGLHPNRIEAWVLGEHGSGQVPPFSRIRVDGRPLELDADARERVRADVEDGSRDGRPCDPDAAAGGRLRSAQCRRSRRSLPVPSIRPRYGRETRPACSPRS